MQIPAKLKERLEKLGIGESIYSQRSRKCILSRARLDLEKVPWHENAYYADASDSLVFDPVSLVPCLALDLKQEDRILDMCAAPGTKTFILSFLTENKARITANDISRNRVMRLEANTKRYGIKCDILNTSGRTLEGAFNKILLDAPCSGEGMVNKKEKIFRCWSERRIRLLSKKQKKLINRALELMELGGTLVYSTCTFSPEENEAVIDFALKKHSDANVEKINVPINHVGGITSWNEIDFDKRVSSCMRIYPQHNGTGGLFVAKLVKRIL